MELLHTFLLLGSLTIVQSCQPWEFECKSSGKCLKSTSRCNKQVECTDGSDELRCPEETPRWTEGPCLEGQFQCDNKHCVYKNWVCDHEDDCGDNSDETNCYKHSKSAVLGVGAVVGISLACSGVLLLFLCTLAYMLYHRVKSVHGLRRRGDPVQEITDIMGSVPYHMPREALLRLPPPQYTSRQDLTRNVQENPGFIVDENMQRAAIPPPVYTSQPDLAFVINQAHSADLPPAYTSRTNLQDVGQGEQEVGQGHRIAGQGHQVSPPLEVYHHEHRRQVRTARVQPPQITPITRSSQNQNIHDASITSATPVTSGATQQRRFRGRISRVRETLPVLNRIASFARRSLSRPRRLHRRSRGNRHNTNAIVEHFYCEKPRALRRQEEHSRLTRQSGSSAVSANRSIHRNTTRATGVESTLSTESRDVQTSAQCSPVKTSDTQTPSPDILLEMCSDMEIKDQDSIIKDSSSSDYSFPLTLTTKYHSVPELTLITHQSDHVTTEERSHDLSTRSGNPISGQKSYSLTHLFDTTLTSLSRHQSGAQKSFLSVDSWNC